jgi:hypothetical protein
MVRSSTGFQSFTGTPHPAQCSADVRPPMVNFWADENTRSPQQPKENQNFMLNG